LFPPDGNLHYKDCLPNYDYFISSSNYTVQEPEDCPWFSARDLINRGSITSRDKIFIIFISIQSRPALRSLIDC
jgi:hypothetical protein